MKSVTAIVVAPDDSEFVVRNSGVRGFHESSETRGLVVPWKLER